MWNDHLDAAQRRGIRNPPEHPPGVLGYASVPRVFSHEFRDVTTPLVVFGDHLVRLPIDTEHEYIIYESFP